MLLIRNGSVATEVPLFLCPFLSKGRAHFLASISVQEEEWLAAGTSEGCVFVWSLTSEQPIDILTTLESEILSMTTSDDGTCTE